jgi:hypothetical protein
VRDALHRLARTGADEDQARRIVALAQSLMKGWTYDLGQDRVVRPEVEEAREALASIPCAAAVECMRAFWCLQEFLDLSYLSAFERIENSPNAVQVLGEPCTEANWTENERKWVGALISVARQNLSATIAQLQHSHPGLRKAACVTAAEALDERAVPHLIRILESDTAFGLRGQAAAVLGVIGSRKALAGLRCALNQQEPDWASLDILMLGRLTPSPATVTEAIERIETGRTQRFLAAVLPTS